MSPRRGLILMAIALAVAACASPASRVAAPENPVAAAPSAPAPEPPRQADPLARIASELVELQNAVAKLMMNARQHDDQLLYLQRRLTELEAQARGRASAPPAFAPSPGGPAQLPPPPVALPPAVLPPTIPAPGPGAPRVTAPLGPAPSASVAARPAPAPPGLPPVGGSASSPTAMAADTLYESGLAKYESGDLDGAVVVLYEVVANFPNETARERAQFLVGEIFLAQKDYRGAVAELEGLIAAVPGGTRVPDALLKIGTAQRALGDEARARRVWERVVKEYPTSAAARQARTLLRAAR